MNREFTAAEKLLIMILALVLIGLVYFKFVLTPVNDQIAQYGIMTETESGEMDGMMTKAAQMKKMQAQIDEIKIGGESHSIPVFDDGRKLMEELKGILDVATDYSLTFSGITRESLETGETLVTRPASISFSTSGYAQARNIINEIHLSENAKSVSDINISVTSADTGEIVMVTMSVLYFEKEGGDEEAETEVTE